MKLGLAGKTVLVASGDTGVSGALGCAGGLVLTGQQREYSNIFVILNFKLEQF
jgi:hypothetical protein